MGEGYRHSPVTGMIQVTHRWSDLTGALCSTDAIILLENLPSPFLARSNTAPVILFISVLFLPRVAWCLGNHDCRAKLYKLLGACAEIIEIEGDVYVHRCDFLGCSVRDNHS